MNVLTLSLSIILSPLALLIASINGLRRWYSGERYIKERFGLWGTTPDKVLWLHGASVGECLSLRPLLKMLSKDSNTPTLLTTTTAAAHSVMGKFHPLVRHHVWDAWPLVAWRIRQTKPIVWVAVESEIWPVWLWALNRCGVPIMLLNARLSKRTMARWRMFSWFARTIFRTISYATTTCEERAQFLREMGVQIVEYQPHLKYMSDPLPVNQTMCDQYKNAIGERPVWMAASVHPNERSVIIEAIQKAPHNTLTIIAPRHIHTVNTWCDELSKLGFKGIKHSEFRGVISDNINYIIVDSMGELPVFYNFTPIVLVAGNLVPDIGGHNIIEPGMFGCAVVWGPHVDSCRDVCSDLEPYGFPLKEANDLAAMICHLLEHPELARQKGQAMQGQLALQQSKLQSWADVWVARMREISGNKCSGKDAV